MNNKAIKFYLARQSKKKLENIAEELFLIINDIDEHVSSLSYKATGVFGDYLEDFILDDVKQLPKKELAKISTSWLQNRYKIGYAKAACCIDILIKKKVISKPKI